MTVRWTLTLLAVVTIGGAQAARVSAQAGASVFTAAQAEAGKKQFETACSPCHGSDLGGGDAPALAGPEFAAAWGTQTTVDLYNYVQGMPPGGTPLPGPDSLSVIAYILQENGATAGDTALQATTSVKIGGIATGKRPGMALAVSHR